MCRKADTATTPRKVLVCEDEPIVALDLQMLIEGFGYDVLGPFASVRQALDALDGQSPDAAVLDVRLRDGEVFPVANKLRDMGVGLVFHSGHAMDEDFTSNYPDARCCHKPLVTTKLQEALAQIVPA
ncbi:response regulator [Roseivivax sp. CAU 1753]